MKKIFQKIVIFGRPGSGKSTFAANLKRETNFPIFHLDKLFFSKNWEILPEPKCILEQQKIYSFESWIIDGNCIAHKGAFEDRFAKADLSIYFNFPRFLCLKRVLQRRFFKDQEIDDRASGCRELIEMGFLKYTWNFSKCIAPLLQMLKHKYPHKHIIEVKTRKDLDLIFKYIKEGNQEAIFKF